MTAPDEGARAGRVYVEVELDVDTLNLQRAAAAASGRWGSEFGRGADRHSNVAFSNIGRGMESWARSSPSFSRAGDVAANRFGVSFGDGINRATSSQLGRISSNLEREFGSVGDRAGRALGDGFSRRVNTSIDRDRFSGLLRSMNSEVDRFTSNLTSSLRLLNFSGLFSPLTILAGTIAALLPVVFALGSSLGQAALSATGAIPAFFGLAGAVGAVTLALRGPLAAFQAYSRAQDSAAQSSNTLATRQASLRSAEEALARAQVDGSRQVAEAQRNLNRARVEAAQEIRNLQAAARSAVLDEEGAQIRLARAREELIRVNRDATATALDRREAAFQVKVAENDLAVATDRSKQAQLEATEAQRLGVEGSTRVQDANRRLQQTQEDANRSIQAAANALTEASRKYDIGSAAQQTFAQRMSELSPAGRAFVEQLISMHRGLDEFSRRLQTAALPGFTQALRDMTGLAPIVSQFMTNLATYFGDVAIRVGNLTETPLFRGQLQAILRGNEVAIRNLGDAFVPLIQALMTIAQQSTPQLIRFTEWLGNVITKFAGFIEAKRQTGELAAALQRAGDEAAKWGAIIGNFATGILNLFRDANPAGQQLADKLLLISQRFREWTEANTEKIRDFFAKMASIDWGRLLQVAAAVTGVVGALRLLSAAAGALEFIAAIFNPAGAFVVGIGLVAAGFLLAYTRVKEFRDAINPFLQEARRLIVEEALPALQKLWQAIVDLGRELRDLGIDWELVGRIIGGFIVGAIGNVTGVIRILTGVIQVSTATVRVFGDWWRWLLDHVLKPVIGWISSTLAPSIGRAIDQAKAIFDGFRRTVQIVMDAVRNTIQDRLNQALQIALRFKDGFLNFFNQISGGVRNALNAVIRVINSAIGLINKILPGNLKIPALGQIGAVGGSAPGPAVPRTSGGSQRFAHGGGVYGPGTGTSDSILARVSHGEHIWTAKEVKSVGGHGAVEALREIALRGYRPPGFQGGGAVPAIIELGRRFGAGPVTSSYRNTNDYHGQGLAVDFGGFNQDSAASKFLAVGGSLLELIHTTNQAFYGIKHGKRVGTDFYGSEVALHRNHIHVAATPTGAQAILGGSGSPPGAGGGGLLGLFDPTAVIKAALKGIMAPFGRAITGLVGAGGGMFGPAMKALLGGSLDKIIEFAASKLGAVAGGGGGVPPGPAVERWRGLVTAVLTELGVNTPGNVNAVLTSIRQESGGNPNITQSGYVDVNTLSGDLAKGLNQVIGATFRAYAGKYVSRGQLDPYANIYASVRYAMARYGARWAQVMAAPGGYDNGGLLMPGAGGINTGSRPEAVFTDKQFRDVIEGRDSGSLENISISLIQHSDYVDAVLQTRDERVHRKLKAGRVR